MKKIIFKNDDIKSLVEGKKCARLSFGLSDIVLEGVLTKHFSSADTKKGFEMLKRYVSSSSFDVIVLDGFGHSLASSSYKDDIIIWLNDHQCNDDFPLLIITGGGQAELPNLIADYT